MNNTTHRREYRMYDFARPEPFTAGQINAIRTIHRRFAEQASILLSEELAAEILIQVSSIDQLPFEEFVRMTDTRSFCAEIEPTPLPGQFSLMLEPAIAYALAARALGGAVGIRVPDRHLSGIELAVLREILSTLTGAMTTAWQSCADIAPCTVSVSREPGLSAAIGGREPVLWLKFSAHADGIEGTMHLALPFCTLEPILSRIEPFSAQAPENSIPGTGAIFLSGATPPMSPDEIRRLRPGALIPLASETAMRTEAPIIRPGCSVPRSVTRVPPRVSSTTSPTTRTPCTRPGSTHRRCRSSTGTARSCGDGSSKVPIRSSRSGCGPRSRSTAP